MDRTKALLDVKYVVDNALNAAACGASGQATEASDLSWLIGWEVWESSDPSIVFVAVNDYLGGSVTREEAIELATDYLLELAVLSEDEGVCPKWVIGPGS